MLQIDLNGSLLFLDSMQYSKEGKYICRYSNSSNCRISVSLPFKINKIKDDIFDAELDIDKIIFLKNYFFAERNLIELKTNIEGENKSVGYIFTLRTIFDVEGIHIENEKLKNYFVRTVVSLLAKKVDFTVDIPKFTDAYDFNLNDFFAEDLVVCAISKHQFHNYDKNSEISLLYHLGLYGFIPIYNNREEVNIPSEVQRGAFNGIMNNGKGSISFKNINNNLLQEPFVEKFIKEYNGKESNEMAKFLLLYQIFEILIDKVLKSEIKNKLDGLSDSISGHKMRAEIQEIGTESFRMTKLFKHYCNYGHSSDYEICYLIESLFDEHFDNKNKKKTDYGAYFYEFRNQIVHNLRIFYKGQQSEVDEKLNQFAKIVSIAEALSIESVVSFNPNKK